MGSHVESAWRGPTIKPAPSRQAAGTREPYRTAACLQAGAIRNSGTLTSLEKKVRYQPQATHCHAACAPQGALGQVTQEILPRQKYPPCLLPCAPREVANNQINQLTPGSPTIPNP